MPQTFIATTRTKTFLFENIADDRTKSDVHSIASKDGLKLTGLFNINDPDIPTHVLLDSDDAIIYN